MDDVPSAEAAASKAKDPLSHWRQGDYSVGLRDFVVSAGIAGGELDVVVERVPGVVVVTQTCDIVNEAPGKEWVVLCPLVALSPERIREIRSGSSPAAVLLDNPPGEHVAVDLNRMMTVHKSVLAALERSEGFNSDEARADFAEALERKHGRFAFPDAFSEHVLAPLRNRISKAHGKAKSEAGESYRSIVTARVQASPDWDASRVEVAFRFVLDPKFEGRTEDVAKTLDDHLGRIEWPKGFHPADPAYSLGYLYDLTASDWVSSRAIDWAFISHAGRAAAG